MNQKKIYDILENPEIFEINRMKAHSDHVYYKNDIEAKAFANMEMKYYLNGNWAYYYSKNVELAPKMFYEEGFNFSNWETIKVPANIELEGKDKPHYVNVMYPWDGSEMLHEPQVPKDYNPTSSYVKKFVVPDNFKGKPVFISLRGVESAFNLWINGNYVGYSEDTHTPADFDLTKFIIDGENTISVQVYKFCSGSWLESQDYWRLSGIFRDVYLYTVPKVHVYDMFIKTDLDDNYENTELLIDLDLNYEERLEIGIDVEIFDQENNVVSTLECITDQEKVTLKTKVMKAKLWSAEKPYLYKLILNIKDLAGNIIESVGQKVGIRKFEMKNGLMCINGKRIVFRGVNRHDFSTYNGRAVTRKEMEHDAKMMKKYNLNAVRTSHYPNQSYWYELCDKYGIYLIDEANLETHGSLYYVIRKEDDKDSILLPDDKKEWRNTVIDRGRSMLERDKNHPSILLWSCGNESHGGKNLYELSEFFKERDTTRLVHYEGITQDKRYDTTSDVESRMYTSPKDIEDYLTNDPKKPFMLCEYSHAMGNSNGGIYKYIELEETYDKYQGGFVWDYIDQCILTKNSRGEDYFAYGGDFEDRPTDMHGIANGMFFADRRPKPEIQELKYVYQGFKIIPTKKYVKIVNKNLFINAKDYEIRVIVARDGEIILTNIHYEDIEPLSEKQIELNLPDYKEVGEYLVTVSMHLKEEQKWAKKGYEIAFGQYIYTIGSIEKTQEILPNIEPIYSTNNIGIKGKDFHFIFSKSYGRIMSLKYKGKEFIEAPRKSIRPTFWRASTDNDNGRNMGYRQGIWKLATEYAKIGEPEVYEKDNYLVINYDVDLPMLDGVKCTLIYKVNALGEIRVKLDYKGVNGIEGMPKFGVDFKVPLIYDCIQWYGRGYEQNYLDKNKGAKLGVFSSRVKDEFVAYTNPQEYGNRTGIRWAKITDDTGFGLKFESTNDVMEFSAIHYTPFELETALHPYELTEPYAVNVTLCKKQMGVGGDDSWGAPVIPEYTINAEDDMSFEFIISMSTNI